METLDLAPPSLVLGGNRYKAILRLALPTVFAMLSQSVVNEIDVVFFSHLPVPESSNAQAALLPSLILTWLFGGSLSAVSVGTQALVARRYAEGDRRAAGAVLANTAFFAVVAGAVFSVIGLLAVPFMVRSIISVPAVQDVAIAYTRWRLYAVISMAATMGIKAFFDGIGKTHVHFVAAIVMNVVNVFLCWTLIFGHLGAPRLGGPGAGLAAFLATWVGLAIMFLYAWTVRTDYRFARWSNISWTTTWAMLRLSIPAALAIVFMMTGFGIFAKNVDHLDAGTLGEPVNSAANTDIIETLKLTFTACMAFGTATATLIGQALGRKQPDEAQKWGWASVRLGVVIFGVVGLCEGVFFTHPLVAFISNSPAVQQAAVFPLRIMGIATPLIAVAMILSEGLFGAGATKFVAAAQTVLIFGLLLPVSWLLGLKLGFGLRGVWVAAFLYASFAALTMGMRFGGGSWKRIKL
jgi:multidrug resistance protein, MATE family